MEHEIHESFLTSSELRKALAPYVPATRSKDPWRRLLTTLPYVLLPGAKRKTYLLSEVWKALEACAQRGRGHIADQVRIESPLHRRKGSRVGLAS